MKILVYTKKGGAGKSSISASIAKKLSAQVITNDTDHVLDQYFEKDEHYIVENHNPMPNIPQKYNLLFDMGGKPDGRILEIAKTVDKIIIPFFYSALYIKPAIASMKELEKVNKNIILVLNKYRTPKKGKTCMYEKTEELFKTHLKRDYPIFKISESLYMEDLFDRGQTAEDRMKTLSGKAKEGAIRIDDQLNLIVEEIKKESEILLEA